MCGIAGFSNINADYTKEHYKWHNVLNGMKEALTHRGPDDDGELLYPQVGLAHTRLSIIDVNRGHQPMTRYKFGVSYTIIYNGEIYNTSELRDNLIRMGYLFKTHTDTEVILTGYMAFGADFVKELNGIFSFAIWDDNLNSLSLFRDRLGIKPLFYTVCRDTLVFASEIKALFEYPEVKPRVDSKGLSEIFAIGPAKTYGSGVFKDVREVLPGSYIVYDKNGLKEIKYWNLISSPHTDTFEETVDRTSFLLRDAVKRQMISDIPICTMLSGGVDSSLVTAICSDELKKEGKQINTYSFDFIDNAKHFKTNSFQPSLDRPYVDIMVKHLGSNHTYLECNNEELVDNLYKAVDARDLPGMGDIDASLLYFCGKVAADNKVALTGECADEIFGGYPWFHNPDTLTINAFPWSKNMDTRKLLLSEDFLSTVDLEAHARNAYEKSIAETPLLAGESKEEARYRQIEYLNLKWFMATLLDRMDRCSMHAGLEARVPFADHRIVEYVWNVPWEMKTPNGVVKGLLREAGKGLIPDEILYRRKSPYPKSYHPGYEKMLADRLRVILSDSNAPIRPLIDKKKAEEFLKVFSDYRKPWYGQLMTGPQMIAYMLQVNYWLEKYKVEII